jgi:trafficking protein particle complex subunit 6
MAPTSNSSNGANKDSSNEAGHPQIADPALEFLIAEIVRYAELSCPPEGPTEEHSIFACEMAAAKLERIGYSVGYRLCERLAQTKTFGTTAGASGNSAKKDPAAAVAASQLEAVKFLCKEFWIEVFRKQIDKLQTNHRGVFVLKDLELRWLTRFPNNQENARVTAIQLLAFPCGMLRGALANLGIPSVVSCDFLTDGQNMASCSFNVKIK